VGLIELTEYRCVCQFKASKYSSGTEIYRECDCSIKATPKSVGLRLAFCIYVILDPGIVYMARYLQEKSTWC